MKKELSDKLKIAIEFIPVVELYPSYRDIKSGLLNKTHTNRKGALYLAHMTYYIIAPVVSLALSK